MIVCFSSLGSYLSTPHVDNPVTNSVKNNIFFLFSYSYADCVTDEHCYFIQSFQAQTRSTASSGAH